MPTEPLTVALLMGPTASGKTRLALELAERLPAEIVSVDSAQVYRDMDIGTAKPSPEERSRVPHHLIDVVAPTERYSAARFAAEAAELIPAIVARGRVPLLVGGTMLYFKALVEGLSELPSADERVRGEIDAEARVRGWQAMHAELATVDPSTAARLKPSDAQRIQRALEVYRLTGTPLASLTSRARRTRAPLRFASVALVPSDRSALHRRIETRFDAMLAAGLVDELRELRRRYELTPALPSMRAVGYRQAWAFLEEELDMPALRDRGIYASRQLAKRQLTWLRATPEATPLDCFDPALLEKALNELRRGLAA